ncbi:MAG: hypothetical protein H0W83_14335 [Planctomycetes bacterium]|nr:hypothetical protein [Planctomycetota bacterium]
MDSMLPFLVVNLIGIVAFASGLAGAQRGRRWALAGAGLVLALLVAKSALTQRPAWEAALFPWPWYIYLQGYWIFAIALLFFGTAIPQLPIRWNRVAMVALSLAILAKGAFATWWMIAPEHHGEERFADADHHCTQSTMYTCAPTSCVCALSYLGIPASEAEMATLCLTRTGGTTVFNTYRGLMLKLAGTDYRPRLANVSAEDLTQDGVTAVIDNPDIQHALAVHGRGADVLVHDPLCQAPQSWSAQHLRESFGGVAIVLEHRSP